MSTTVQIIEATKSAWELIKFKIENIKEKKFEIFPYCSSVDKSLKSFSEKQPSILVADLKALYDYDIEKLEERFQNGKSFFKLVILASPNQMDGIQRMVEIGVAALVMKPISNHSLSRALLRIQSQFEISAEKSPSTLDHFVTFKTNRSNLYLNQEDLLIVESRRNICTITIKDGMQHVVNENITSIAERLTLKSLIRIDKSTIINLSKINYLGTDKYSRECKLKLSNNQELAITLSKIAMVRIFKLFVKRSEKES